MISIMLVASVVIARPRRRCGLRLRRARLCLRPRLLLRLRLRPLLLLRLRLLLRPRLRLRLRPRLLLRLRLKLRSRLHRRRGLYLRTLRRRVSRSRRRRLLHGLKRRTLLLRRRRLQLRRWRRDLLPLRLLEGAFDTTHVHRHGTARTDDRRCIECCRARRGCDGRPALIVASQQGGILAGLVDVTQLHARRRYVRFACRHLILA